MVRFDYNNKYFRDRAEGPRCLAYLLGKFLEQKGVKKILDVGCGSGWLIRHLRQQGFNTTGCDSALEAVKISGGIRADATSLPFKDGSFDAVLGVSLIEHLTKKTVKQFLKEACRILKRNGILFLETPNYATLLRLLLGKRWGGYFDPSHVNLYTPGSLKKLLKNYPLTDFQITFPYYPDTPFDWGHPGLFNLFPQWLKNLLSLLVFSTPLCYLRHSFWLAACRK